MRPAVSVTLPSSRQLRYAAILSARCSNPRLSADLTLQNPTLSTKKRLPRDRHNRAQENSDQGCPHGPPHSSSICPPPATITASRVPISRHALISHRASSR